MITGMKYDNCKDCYSLCVHAGNDREFVCMNGVSCKIAKAKPKTNANRFRAMSDGEQQNFVRKFWEIEDFADWLQQPAE